MFSVIIPLYNKGSLVKRAIDSVLSQSCQDFEIIVVDDGSKDKSADYVTDYTDERIKYFYKDNGGVSSARNYGIEKSTKEWIVFLDADDELLPNALEIFRTLINGNKDVLFVVGGIKWIKGSLDKSILETDIIKRSKLKFTRHPHFHFWCNNFYAAPRNMAVHKDAIKKFGGYDTRMSFYEDFEFSLRTLKCGSVAYTTTPISVYYQESTGLSGSSHPIEREMAYYIPEYVETASFWHKALLYENLELEILWWQQRGNEENVKFYQDMQKNYFGRIYLVLHWIRQKMIRHGVI